MALAAWLSVPAVHAQTAAPAAAQTVVITGNPLGREAAAAPVSVLAGSGLLLRRAGTLGETLDGLPGVSASGFGPNSSRPVIRGLDGDRVRLLDGGAASIDASNLSFDHASATDPLVAERIEVLRGPAALLYGGNATGGVVNVIDNRIPRVVPVGALSGRAEVRFGGAAAERAGAVVLEGGAGGFAWHADAHGRQASDLRTPRYTPIEDGQALEPTKRVRNSAARTEGGALGAGWVGAKGYLGASFDTGEQRYGVTVEPDVIIRMKRDRSSLAGELRALGGPIAAITAQASHTRYRHDEVEGSGEIGTTFRSTGDELRLQLRHAPLGPLQGVFGVQTEKLDFSALGEEAFVPGTRTRSTALFALEELDAGPVRLGFGLRTERVRVASVGDAPDAAEPRFGAAVERRFSPRSASVQASLGTGPGWQLGATLGHTERAPAYYELYANGVHVATAAYERGDATLPTERSRHAELGLGWSGAGSSLKFSLWQTRFARYIALDATGVDIVVPGENGDPDSSVPEYAFRSVGARLQGLELEGRTRLFDAGAGRPFALELSGSLDRVSGRNTSTGEALPRLAPLRLRLALQAQAEGWQAGVALRHAARQSRVPATDTATPGHTLLDLTAAGALPMAWAGGRTQWFAKLSNVTDRVAINAAAIDTVRGLSPAGGRALSVGLRATF
ncbi:TonB-dependent receptor [Rubrivivax rivuli]|uniref:TonB-dependent receptor n=1 Tax=Rubrivivax rivuli TaxID=1862385 RepID=UPI002873B95C|nr:TonB-dependent receptor [Rubrivivax rivuli]